MLALAGVCVVSTGEPEATSYTDYRCVHLRRKPLTYGWMGKCGIGKKARKADSGSVLLGVRRPLKPRQNFV